MRLTALTDFYDDPDMAAIAANDDETKMASNGQA